MGWNADTGQWTPDVFRQPLGAMGAVTNYNNARQAAMISDSLEQEREAQVAREQQATEQARHNMEIQDAARKAMTELPPDASSDVIGRKLMEFEPMQAFPWLRTQASAKGKVDTARVNQAGSMYKAAIAAGQTPQQAGMFLRAQGYTPEELAGLSTESAPVPAAKVGLMGAEQAKTEEQAIDIRATRQARINLINARAELAGITERLKALKAKGGTVTPQALATIVSKKATLIRLKNALENQTDKNTGLRKRLSPEDQAEVDNAAASLSELDQILGAAKASNAAAGPPTGTKVANPTTTTLSPQAQALMPP